MFFRYNSFSEFNFAFVGHVDDYGSDITVTLLDGRRCTVHYGRKDEFYKAFGRYKEQCQLVALPPSPLVGD